MNPDPHTRAERGFHPGGASAPAHAFRPKDLTFNFFTGSFWTRGDFRGVLGVTHNRVWVVDRATHPGPRATPPKEGIFKGICHAALRRHD